MTTTVLRSIKGYRMRVTQLSDCGDPIVSSGCGTVVSDGFIRVSISGEYDAGEQFIARNLFGQLCINDRDPDQLIRATVEVQMCGVDPDLLLLMTGDAPLLASGEAFGTAFAPTRNFAGYGLELWTKAVGQSCSGQWGYFVLPFVRNGRMDGSMTIENGTMTVTVRGEAAPVPATWGTGPYGDSPLGQAFPTGAIYAQAVTSVQPPALVDLSLCPDRLLGGAVFWIDSDLSATV